MPTPNMTSGYHTDPPSASWLGTYYGLTFGEALTIADDIATWWDDFEDFLPLRMVLLRRADGGIGVSLVPTRANHEVFRKVYRFAPADADPSTDRIGHAEATIEPRRKRS